MMFMPRYYNESFYFVESVCKFIARYLDILSLTTSLLHGQQLSFYFNCHNLKIKNCSFLCFQWQQVFQHTIIEKNIHQFQSTTHISCNLRSNLYCLVFFCMWGQINVLSIINTVALVCLHIVSDCRLQWEFTMY